MIREDEARVELLPQNLRDAAERPEQWDIPGLLRDAAERIEWLETSNREIAGNSMRDREAAELDN